MSEDRPKPPSQGWDTITPYHRGFREFAEGYEAFGFAEIHAGALPFLPPKPGLMLDIGAGSGRDADWFAAKGWEVVAVEPAAALRQEAARRHPSPAIRWVDDRLPALAAALHRALADAARLIATMPATHLTFADNAPVFPTTPRRPSRAADPLTLGAELLWGYGTTAVPLHVWQALRRMAAWIEPMLVAEWVRLTQAYGARAGRAIPADAVMQALQWAEPLRDTALVRDLVAGRIARGAAVACVWTGEPLRMRGIEIDHCLPWSAWACNDLWNLLPASRAANQRKSGLIVAAGALAEARPRILAWWEDAYRGAEPALRTRFAEEARTTLPLPQEREPALDELFAALEFRRLRLRQETQLPEWAGYSIGAATLSR